MTRVKICGIRNIDEALAVQRAGAWALGEVLAPSPRRISPETAAAINRVLGKNIKRVGVFVDEELSTLKQIARECGLDIIQLHGNEPPEYIEELDLPVIKSFSVDGSLTMENIMRWPAWAYLFDSPGQSRRGGTGCTFDWSQLRDLTGLNNIILAGGLTPDNVQEAIRMVRPMAVDVSSGVEFPGGGKDPARINRFIAKVMEVDRYVS